MKLSCDRGCHIISEENKNNKTFFDWIRYMLLKIRKISFGAKSSLLYQIYRKPSTKLALHFEGRIRSTYFSPLMLKYGMSHLWKFPYLWCIEFVVRPYWAMPQLWWIKYAVSPTRGPPHLWWVEYAASPPRRPPHLW